MVHQGCQSSPQWNHQSQADGIHIESQHWRPMLQAASLEWPCWWVQTNWTKWVKSIQTLFTSKSRFLHQFLCWMWLLDMPRLSPRRVCRNAESGITLIYSSYDLCVLWSLCLMIFVFQFYIERILYFSVFSMIWSTGTDRNWLKVGHMSHIGPITLLFWNWCLFTFVINDTRCFASAGGLPIHSSSFTWWQQVSDPLATVHMTVLDYDRVTSWYLETEKLVQKSVVDRWSMFFFIPQAHHFQIVATLAA